MNRTRIAATSLLMALTTLASITLGDDWKSAAGPLATQWVKDVSPTNALPEYPRPQMTRKLWQNLNGLWQFRAAKEDELPPIGKDLSAKILVPYPPESALSGLMRHEDRMWYRRTFDVPKKWAGNHVLLHLDAVDWDATVYVNGQKVGEHKGGYDAFGYDITNHLKTDSPQELIVGVFNPADQGDQPHGKQKLKPGGIFYTPTSGIWQTVWIEPVKEAFIERLEITPDVDAGEVKLVVSPHGVMRRTPIVATITPPGGGAPISADGFTGRPLSIKIPDAKLWSPETPVLYDLSVQLKVNNAVSDEVGSYFGMRKISVAKDEHGINRLLLNNKPYFMAGPLDQGFWPDGIYTAPTDAALKFDIEQEKKYGFNMVRKHVKVEPERWYSWCDKLGLLVWQDMPSGPSKQGAGEKMPQASKENFEHELDRMIAGRGNHPSIVMWVVFNEGWGQFDTPRLVEHVKKTDPSRLVDNASGWTDKKAGDVMDMHHYPDPAMPKLEDTRAAVLGEFGGLGLAIEGHMWPGKSWQYRGTADQSALTDSYVKMFEDAKALKEKGLCAVVYTQTTDVETESNGLMTYDRAVNKVEPERAAKAARELIGEEK
jgi:beta-galactosidase/beta-glucuronidase